MKIISIADTHGFHSQVSIPEGDVLVVAGDVCLYGTLKEVKDFGIWLAQQPCTYKIVIAGNHDEPFECEREAARDLLVQDMSNIIYLQDSLIEIDHVIFYGSPWTPTFLNWNFMADKGEVIREKWALIPQSTDVLITHGPPAMILDNANGTPLGCPDLLERISHINPQYHIFGHIHEGYGRTSINGVTFINTSVCNGRYRPANKPCVFEI